MNLTGLLGGALALTLCALSGADAANWVLLSVSKDDFVYIDKQSIKSSAEGIVKAWTKYEKKSPTDPIKEILGHTEYDCVQEKYRNLAGHEYYRNGRVERYPEELYWEHMIPGSIIEDIFRYLCEKVV